MSELEGAQAADLGAEASATEVKTRQRSPRYYMRGPGPKWREKHAQARGSSLR
jgi:hypothetical protein